MAPCFWLFLGLNHLRAHSGLRRPPNPAHDSSLMKSWALKCWGEAAQQVQSVFPVRAHCVHIGMGMLMDMKTPMGMQLRISWSNSVLAVST